MIHSIIMIIKVLHRSSGAGLFSAFMQDDLNHSGRMDHRNTDPVQCAIVHAVTRDTFTGESVTNASPPLSLHPFFS